MCGYVELVNETKMRIKKRLKTSAVSTHSCAPTMGAVIFSESGLIENIIVLEKLRAASGCVKTQDLVMSQDVIFIIDDVSWLQPNLNA